MSDTPQTVSELKYAAPKLVVYGSMAALTASGSGERRENNQGNGQPMERP